MLYTPRSLDFSEPESLLTAFSNMNKGYYQLFALHFYISGKFFLFDGFSLAPGRLAYQASLNGDYHELVAKNIIEHWFNLGKPNPYSLSEMGCAECLFLSKLLDYIQKEQPDLYSAIGIYAIDYTLEYEPHQKINLEKHLPKITFVRQNVFSLSKLPQFDYIILNELLDDLPATAIKIINNKIYLEAFCKRLNCSDRQGEIVLIPLDDLDKYPNLKEDYQKILDYQKRLSFEMPEEPFIAYIGIEQFFSQLKLFMKPEARIWLMDYFRKVPTYSFAIGFGIDIEHNIGTYCNLTVHLDYDHLKRIAEYYDFIKISDFQEIGSRYDYPNTYYVVILDKIS